MVPYRRILVFGAHPDDEMAMSGTIREIADAGGEVYICTLASGSGGYYETGLSKKIVAMRAEEQKAADEFLGTKRRWNLGAEDGAVANDLPTRLECVRIIRETRPEAVFTHRALDKHPDHRATHAATVDAVGYAGSSARREISDPWQVHHVYCHCYWAPPPLAGPAGR